MALHTVAKAGALAIDPAFSLSLYCSLMVCVHAHVCACVCIQCLVLFLCSLRAGESYLFLEPCCERRASGAERWSAAEVLSPPLSDAATLLQIYSDGSHHSKQRFYVRFNWTDFSSCSTHALWIYSPERQRQQVLKYPEMATFIFTLPVKTLIHCKIPLLVLWLFSYFKRWIYSDIDLWTNRQQDNREDRPAMINR